MTTGPESEHSDESDALPAIRRDADGQGMLFGAAFEYSQYPPSPIPSPNDLAKYDELSPGLARELVDMAKKEQEHRHKRELFPYLLSKRGQTLGVVAMVLLLIFCGWLVQTGNVVAGTVLAGLDVLGIVTVFVTGSFGRRRRESEE